MNQQDQSPESQLQILKLEAEISKLNAEINEINNKTRPFWQSTKQLFQVGATIFLGVLWFYGVYEPLNEKELRSRELDAKIQEKENRLVQLQNDSIQSALRSQLRIVEQEKVKLQKSNVEVNKYLVVLREQKDAEIKKLQRKIPRRIQYEQLNAEDKAMMDTLRKYGLEPPVIVTGQ